jgi:hypothetical protein
LIAVSDITDREGYVRDYVPPSKEVIEGGAVKFLATRAERVSRRYGIRKLLQKLKRSKRLPSVGQIRDNDLLRSRGRVKFAVLKKGGRCFYLRRAA